MTAPLEAWDERIRALFGLSLLGHPARLRDGLTAACKDLGIDDDAALLTRVDRGDHEAKSALARALTIGETYFFREPNHFALLRESLLPRALQRTAGPVVLVSAACSSGEEAYSMAIVAREVLGAGASGNVRVVGVDVNERSLTAARRGVYRAWSLRGVGNDVRSRWFDHAVDTEEWSIKPEARSLTAFERKNLVDATDALAPASVDVIFCRNVLIYLDDTSVIRVLEQLSRALRPGGALIVSSAEAGLFAQAGLGTHEVEGTWVHTHADALTPGGAELAAAGRSTPAPRSVASSVTPVPRRGERRARRAPAPRAAASSASSASSDSSTPPAASSSAPPGASSTSASTSFDDATRCLEEGWAVLASDPESAGEQARRAILLDRTLAAAHVLAASAALARSDARSARRSLRHAQRYLATTPSRDVVRGGGGATAAEMVSYCARLERALEEQGR